MKKRLLIGSAVLAILLTIASGIVYYKNFSSTAYYSNVEKVMVTFQQSIAEQDALLNNLEPAGSDEGYEFERDQQILRFRLLPMELAHQVEEMHAPKKEDIQAFHEALDDFVGEYYDLSSDLANALEEDDQELITLHYEELAELAEDYLDLEQEYLKLQK